VQLLDGGETAPWCVIVTMMAPMDATERVDSASAIVTGLEKNVRRMIMS